MRRGIALIAALVAVTLTIAASSAAPRQQDSRAATIAGPWTGEIRVAGVTLQMRVVFTEAGDAVSAAIDIPQQGASAVPLRNVTRDGDRVRFELPAGPGVAIFDGARSGDRIEGTFTQGAATGTFVLQRGDEPPPAEPPPADLPYDVEEVTFGHGDVRLAGTLTTPRDAGRVPAVVLISGSGSQTRDEVVAGFEVFGTLADELTRAGIAVLRYDDRGVGASTGPADVTTAAYAADVLAAVERLRAAPRIAPARVGLLGHSEGALVAAMAANQAPDVAFVVLMAGTAVPGEQVVRAQAEAMVRAGGGDDAAVAAVRAQQDRLFGAIRSGEGWDDLEARARAQGATPAVIAQQLAGAKSAWYRAFIDYDPIPMLRQLSIPVLALFGGKDLQVLVDQNRPPLEAQFTGERASLLTVRAYDDANHLFQPARTGAPAEYAMLPKRFVSGFAADVAAWILNRPR